MNVIISKITLLAGLCAALLSGGAIQMRAAEMAGVELSTKKIAGKVVDQSDESTIESQGKDSLSRCMLQKQLFDLTIGQTCISEADSLTYDCTPDAFEEAHLSVCLYEQYRQSICEINSKASRLPATTRKEVMKDFLGFVQKADSMLLNDSVMTFTMNSSEMNQAIFLDGVGRVSKDVLDKIPYESIDWVHYSSNPFGGGGEIVVQQSPEGNTPMEERPGRYSLVVVNNIIREDIRLSDLFLPDVRDEIECISMVKVSDAMKQYGEKGKKGFFR
jgi:hypothetical protein